MDGDLRNLILDIFENSLEAQLRAVRRLREPGTPAARKPKTMSQVDMAYDILKRARGPLHISVLLDRMQSTFGVAVDRESLGSSLSKKIARRDRFTRTGKNTFALLAEAK